MKYKVVGTYKHETVVDTDSFIYKNWRKSWGGRDYTKEDLAIQVYARDMLNYSIVDDEGHGTLTALSLDWTVKEVK